MAKAGRKARAEFDLIAESGGRAVVVRDRPEPLSELGEAEMQVWRQVTDALPHDWFPQESWHLLAQYCRHVVTARNVAALIEKFYREQQQDVPLDVNELRVLLLMQKSESVMISSLAGKMRLSQSSTIHPESAGRGKRDRGKGAAGKPWDFQG